MSPEGFAPGKSNDALGRTGCAGFKQAGSLKVLVEGSSLGISLLEGVRASGTLERVEVSGMPDRFRASG